MVALDTQQTTSWSIGYLVYHFTVTNSHSTDQSWEGGPEGYRNPDKLGWDAIRIGIGKNPNPEIFGGSGKTREKSGWDRARRDQSRDTLGRFGENQGIG